MVLSSEYVFYVVIITSIKLVGVGGGDMINREQQLWVRILDSVMQSVVDAT